MKRVFGTSHMLRRFLTGTGILFLIGAGTVLWWSKDLPDPQNIRESRISESTKIYDSTGTHLLYEIGESRRTYVTLDRISPLIIKATLAAEDDQFYQHHGLDVFGILRALAVNIRGKSLQGGSTITQQLVKNSILSPERTIQRKTKEAVLALELEQRFTKDQIMEMYLNTIPYGNRSYGIEAAAHTFFGVSAQDVTLAQATTLAALPKAPTYYSPYGSHREDLKNRQEHIVSRMESLSMITDEEAERAKNDNPQFNPLQESIQAPHFVFYIKELLEQQYGERIVGEAGLKVTTTLDIRLQTIAEESLKKQQESLRRLGVSNAALVAINPGNGDILAMAGSVDYFNEEIDGNVNVTVRHRSPGSSIKPFIYAKAFEKGLTPDTILIDAETDFGQGYRPKNYTLQERGPVTMRSALANSLNIPAVKTLYLAGVADSTDLARNMGMESLNNPERYGLSLVLGGGEVRLLDITSAYGVFATEGVRFPHRAILKIEDQKEVLFDSANAELVGDQVIDGQIARIVTDILSDNNARAPVFGTNSFLQLGRRPIAAKTGTTQEFRDGWAIGYTPSLVAGVWAGNNDNSPMNDTSPGAQTAAPIWNTFMREALNDTPIERFTKPEPLTNIPHAVMRGELQEIKGKWDPDGKKFYSLTCPVNRGTPRTFKEIHSVLFYVRRANPLGNPPENAESDPQFRKWEEGVKVWIEKHNEKEKNNPESPLYSTSLPIPICDEEQRDDLPIVTITEPRTSILRESPTTIKAEVESQHAIKEVRFLANGRELKRRDVEEQYEAELSFQETFSGRITLLVIAITENNLIGRAHRTFTINPDDSLPSIILHTPQHTATLTPENFPVTIKVTADDPSGIDLVDMLFKKEEKSGTTRIGRTTTRSPTAPNRYEVIWDDSPGPGQYEIYAIVYDKTGNTAESERHAVTIH